MVLKNKKIQLYISSNGGENIGRSYNVLVYASKNKDVLPVKNWRADLTQSQFVSFVLESSISSTEIARCMKRDYLAKICVTAPRLYSLLKVPEDRLESLVSDISRNPNRYLI